MGLIKKINALEPLWWSLFGLGGAIAAFLFPVHILLQGVLIPFGWVSPDAVSYERVSSLLSSPLVKIYLFILIVPPLFHAAHRIRLTIEDLRIEWLSHILPLFCYGGAVVMTFVTLVVILSV